MLQRYYKFKLFSPKEAWALFRLAAIGEAVGWTVLITGMVLGHYLKSNIPVLIAGQFHGIFYIFYFVMAILTAPSLGWTIKKSLLAIVCGIPPYGSLIFEEWEARHMKQPPAKK